MNRYREVERKFEAEPGSPLPDLAGAGGTVGEAVESPPDATYLDTTDARLARQGITLRRRTGGDDAGWHLKLPAGQAERIEVRLPLGRATRDIGYTPAACRSRSSLGSWVRDAQPVDLSGWNQNDAARYLDAVKKLSVAQTSLPASTVIDGGFTVAQLGVLPMWNAGAADTAGEFATLSTPYSDAKPGKIAFALQYKLSLTR